MADKWDQLGSKVADIVSRFVGSWKFVFLYTASLVLWIALHKAGILKIDGPDFVKWNLWLSYFAGTQASIVLMSSERQSRLDRKRLQKLMNQVEMLDEVLEDFIEEQESKNE